MRRRLIPAIAIPVSVCLTALMIPSASHKNLPCKGQMECCIKKSPKPENKKMIMETLPHQFILIVK